MHLQKPLFLFIFVILCGCAKSSSTFETSIDAPKGSYIKPLMSNNDSYESFDVHIAKNFGKHRQETETAFLKIPMDFKTITFTLKGNKGFGSIKTPLTLFEIIDPVSKKLYTKLRYQQGVYWLEYDQYYTKLPLYIDTEFTKFSLLNQNNQVTLTIKNMPFSLPDISQKTQLNIGIKRTDLMRYKGLVVPEQDLLVKNIHIVR